MPVVEAVAAFAPPDEAGRKAEAAMTAAVLQAYSQGITDPVVIKQMMLDAVAKVKNG